MALPHLLIGLQQRGWENLFFALAALSVAGIALAELMIMHSRTTEEIGRAQQLTHVPIFVLVVAIVGFVHFYFGSGKSWLGASVIAVRFVSLILNFALPPNLNFREVTSLRPLHFLGETIALPEGIRNPWTRLGELSSLLLLVYVADAAIKLCRRGSSDDCRRGSVVGGSIAVFILVAAGVSALTNAGVLHLPYLISFPFLGVVMAMGFELSYDIFRAADTARQLRISEGALRESEVRMSLAASAANLGLWVWNIQRDEIWITAEGRTLFGFAQDESLNLKRFLKAIHDEDRPRLEALIRASLQEGGEYEREYRLLNHGGPVRWVAAYGRVEFDEKNEPAFIRGVVRDITKRKLAEEALRESEARFRNVADVAPVLIWMSGPKKEGIFFNKGWLEFTGRTLDQELGDGWLKGIHPEDLTNTLEVCGAAFGKREPFTVEFRLRRNDGEYRWLIDTGTPRFESDGSFLGYIGSCIDIGDRKQAELDHQLQSIELARVGRLALMGELAASLAHEINNPLGAMVTNASAGQRLLAHDQLSSEELRDLLGDIVADGDRAREVIEGIRNMVRKGGKSHTLIEIRDVIRDLLRIVRADAAAKNVNLVAEVDANPGVVVGDRVQLLQVMLNLTMNAFEAMTTVRPEARRVVIHARPAQDEGICLSVRDAGPGIQDSIVAQLFEPFFSTKAEGTGMGLAIARSIVEAHGGTLTGENCKDGGAIFKVCLPDASEAKSQAA